jgi:hypothetical protein
MPFITERVLANTLDVPISLPTTEIRMADWLLIATVSIATPTKLTYRVLNLSFLNATVALNTLTPQNLINASNGYCYVGMYLNYVSGDPSLVTALDILPATGLGNFTRTANPVVALNPGTYSWLAVNNIQYSDQNALLPLGTSADFQLCITGQCRLELDLSS